MGISRMSDGGSSSRSSSSSDGETRTAELSSKGTTFTYTSGPRKGTSVYVGDERGTNTVPQRESTAPPTIREAIENRPRARPSNISSNIKSVAGVLDPFLFSKKLAPQVEVNSYPTERTMHGELSAKGSIYTRDVAPETSFKGISRGDLSSREKLTSFTLGQEEKVTRTQIKGEVVTGLGHATLAFGGGLVGSVWDFGSAVKHPIKTSKQIVKSVGTKEGRAQISEALSEIPQHPYSSSGRLVGDILVGKGIGYGVKQAPKLSPYYEPATINNAAKINEVPLRQMPKMTTQKQLVFDAPPKVKTLYHSSPAKVTEIFPQGKLTVKKVPSGMGADRMKFDETHFFLAGDEAYHGFARQGVKSGGTTTLVRIKHPKISQFPTEIQKQIKTGGQGPKLRRDINRHIKSNPGKVFPGPKTSAGLGHEHEFVVPVATEIYEQFNLRSRAYQTVGISRAEKFTIDPATGGRVEIIESTLKRPSTPKTITQELSEIGQSYKKRVQTLTTKRAKAKKKKKEVPTGFETLGISRRGSGRVPARRTSPSLYTPRRKGIGGGVPRRKLLPTIDQRDMPRLVQINNIRGVGRIPTETTTRAIDPRITEKVKRGGGEGRTENFGRGFTKVRLRRRFVPIERDPPKSKLPSNDKDKYKRKVQVKRKVKARKKLLPSIAAQELKVFTTVAKRKKAKLSGLEIRGLLK